MKNFRRKSVIPGLFFFFAALPFSFINTASAQVKYHSENLNLSIKGTTSLQDWELKSDKGEVEAMFGLGKNDMIKELYSLWFTVETQSLKGKPGAMENSVYKALKASSYDDISFVLKTATINKVDSNHFDIVCVGTLTVAGTPQETTLLVNCKLNDDKTFLCTGSKKLKMTDFNIKPPTAGLGTVKAGDEISIAYNLTIGKKAE
jgi:hypothetical protein